MIKLYRVVMPLGYFYMQVNYTRVVGVTCDDQRIVGRGFAYMREWIAEEQGVITEEETM